MLPSAAIIQADITRQLDRERLLAVAPHLYGLVVLAGDPARVSDPALFEGAIERSYEVNYLGPILLARETTDRMRATNTPGAIVLISSMQANALFAGSTAYAAQKAALDFASLIWPHLMV